MEFLLALTTVISSLFGSTVTKDEIDFPIVMYHHIEEKEENLNEFMVTPDKFEKDMKKIKEMGYQTVSYEEVYNFVYNNGTLPEKPIMVTFDDGYESNYKYAFPVLKKLNMKATIAVIGCMVGQDTYKGREAFKHFTYEEAKEMYKSGLIDIQSHTYDLHDVSIRVGIKRNSGEDENRYINLVKNDLRKSVNELKNKVGNNQFVFTYPYGANDELTERILKELGFKITVTTDVGTNHIVRGNKDSLYKLKRFGIKNDTDIVKLLSNI